MATVLNDRSCVHTLAANTADRAYTYTAYLYGETNTAGRRRGTLCCTALLCKQVGCVHKRNGRKRNGRKCISCTV